MTPTAPISQSTALAERLARVECAGVSSAGRGFTPRFWATGDGCWLTDVDGNKFLDFTSSFGVAGLGYSDPLVRDAVAEQISQIGHTMTGIFPTRAYTEALEAICRTVGRTSAPQALLSNSGAEAIESAIKLATRITGRSGVIAFNDSYHGLAFGALAATGYSFLRRAFERHLSGCVCFAPYPNPYRPWCSCTSAELVGATLELVESMLDGPTPIGAILVEPMQNPAGYIAPPAGFLVGLRRICTERNIILICDEIFTGYGRCGQWLLADEEKVIPDIVCVGKIMSGGYPIAAAVMDKSFAALIVSEELVPLHGGTFFGHPVCCAAANAAISTLENRQYVSSTRSRGESLLRRIQNIAVELPHIGHIRGKGFAIALEFVTDRRTKEPDSRRARRVAAELLSEGLVTLISGLKHYNVVAICPPLAASDTELEHGISILKRTLLRCAA